VKHSNECGSVDVPVLGAARGGGGGGEGSVGGRGAAARGGGGCALHVRLHHWPRGAARHRARRRRRQRGPHGARRHHAEIDDPGHQLQWLSWNHRRFVISFFLSVIIAHVHDS
jgi:hypothetical protein